VANRVGRAAGDVTVLERELARLAQALAGEPDDARLQNQYDALLQRINTADTGRAVLIVSHARTFLDRTVNRILAIDPHQQSLQEYDGNYSAYREQLALAREKQWTTYNDLQGEIRRVKQDILRAKAQAARTEREASSVRIGGEKMKLKGYKEYQRSTAKKVAKKSKARERKLERYLDSGERVEKPSQSRSIRLDLADTAHLGQSVLSLVDLQLGYEAGRPGRAWTQYEVGLHDPGTERP